MVSNWGGGALGGASQNTGVAAIAKNQLLISANSDKPPQVATPGVEQTAGGSSAASLAPAAPVAPAPVTSIGASPAAATSKASSAPKLTEAPQCEPLDPLSCNKNLMEVCSFSNGTYRCICPPNFSRLPDGRCLGMRLLSILPLSLFQPISVANECFDVALNNCSIDATCTDQAIGFSCKCRDGFVDTSPDAKNSPGRSCKQSLSDDFFKVILLSAPVFLRF